MCALLSVVCRRAHVYLTFLCVCLYIVDCVQQILCCVLLRLVYPMLPVSLDCPFFIVPSIFFNVYLPMHKIIYFSFVSVNL